MYGKIVDKINIASLRQMHTVGASMDDECYELYLLWNSVTIVLVAPTLDNDISLWST